jgi:hypothetical protein
MKRLIGLLLAIAIVVSVVPYARSLGTPPSPPGVSAKNWIPFGDAAGFVVTQPLPGDPIPAPGAVKGYFMVRQGDNWLRVESRQDMQVQPATITR